MTHTQLARGTQWHTQVSSLCRFSLTGFLKIQELDDYLRNVRGNAETRQGVVVLRPEQEILDRYQELQTSANRLGNAIAQLRQIPEPNRTPAQQLYDWLIRPIEAELAQVNGQTLIYSPEFVDLDFSLDAVRPLLNEYNIIHFATHTAFASGVPEQSFIGFGSGEYPTLQDVQNWTLNNIDLVVLSACETGVGGLGNGEEVLGLGYVFQDRGAKAVIASLWSVDDGGRNC